MARTQLYPPSVDPGFPKLDRTPQGWKRTTFGEVLEAVERPIKLESEQTYQLVTAKRSRGGIISRGFLTGREILTKSQFEIKAGDFLISRRQIIHGACGVVPDDLDGAIVSNEYSTLRARPALLMEFLRHYSHTPYFQRTCFHSSHGVDVEKMIFKINEWFAREVDLPPVGEQRKIAAVLSSVDEAIEATQAVVDQLQVVKNATMAELLTRGLPGRHTRFKQTEIGEVPEEWDVVLLGTACSVTSGGTPDRSKEEYWNGGIPWVKTGEINYAPITYTEETISAAGIKNSAAKIVPRGSLLLAMYGQGATRGRVAMLGIDAALNQACLAILTGTTFDNKFLFHVLTSRYDSLRSMGHEGTQKNLNAALIKALTLPLPSRDEQEKITHLLDAIVDRENCERALLNGLGNVKSALMSILLTGEVRVVLDEPATSPNCKLDLMTSSTERAHPLLEPTLPQKTS